MSTFKKFAFSDAKRQRGLKSETSPYSMCFRGVLHGIIKDQGFQAAAKEPNADLSFVVESGHKNNPDVQQRFDAIKGMAPARFGSLRFEDKKKHIALQAADFIAFYSRQNHNELNHIPAL